MKNEIEPVLINEEYLRNKIHTIRGQKVMLDSDLAMLYGYSTKRFNEQVQRNIEKFESDFMFQLTIDEVFFISRSQNATSRNMTMFKDKNSTLKMNENADLSRSQNATLNEEREINSSRCQNGTLKVNDNADLSRSQNVTLNVNNNKRGFNIKYRPYVFTEQGIYMLMTVLKGDLAIKQSKALIRLFKRMKDYIVENRELIPYEDLELRTRLLERRTEDNTSAIKTFQSGLNEVMANFINPSSYKHFLILDGRKLEADDAYIKIFETASKSIIYIDDYINDKTLILLSHVHKNVQINIFSDNKANHPLKSHMLEDFKKQNPHNIITLQKSNNKFHDRYIVIDFNTKYERIYHCGSSLKDAGNKITTIMEIADTKQYTPIIKSLLNNKILLLK